MGKKYIFSNEQSKYILNNYSQFSRKKISQQLNVSEKIIYRFLKENNLIIEKPKNLNVKHKVLQKPWNDYEKQYLIENYIKLDNNVIAEKLNRPIQNVLGYVRKLGLVKCPHLKHENIKFVDNYLKENYNKKSIHEMSIELNKTEKTIKQNLYKLKLIPIKSFTGFNKNDIDFILENKDTMSLQKIGEHLNIDRRNISRYLTENNISRKYLPPACRRIMTLNDEQEKFILDNYITMSYKDISQTLDIPQHYVMETLRKNGLYLKTNKTRKSQTEPEKIVNNILIENNINFLTESTINGTKYQCDFQLKDNSNKLIEVLGDYWHYNPKKYGRKNMQKKQKNKVKKDKRKSNILKKLGYDVLYLWEDDLKNNINICKKRILKFVND